MGRPLLSLQAIGLRYGQIQALQDITLDIMAGERIAIVGANGAGKSSLMDVMSGFVLPSAGELYFDGQSITHYSLQKRVALGVMRSFQRSRLFGQMTVLDHLRCAASVGHLSLWQRYAFWRDMKGDAASEVRLQEIAESFGLSLHASVTELNYAHQRLLEVGMMLAGDAKVLLLDEPTAGLSEIEAAVFLKQLEMYAKDKTVVFIEHDMKVVRALADRVLVLEQGKVLECDAWENLQ